MLCEECQKQPATVHLTKIINGHKSEINLCAECAQQHQELSFGFEPISIHKFLANLLEQEYELEGPLKMSVPQPQLECESCGLTYQQFSQIGRLGCSDCYNYFSDRIAPLLRRIHGSEQHTGKVPERSGGSIRLIKEIERLRLELQRLVFNEEFEKAAQVRDQIRELEKLQGKGAETSGNN